MHCFQAFATDLELIERLVTEESVFCLPGQCFDFPNYMRIVLTVPQDLTVEACNRIASFCRRHYSVHSNGVKNVVVLESSESLENGS